MAKEKIEKTQPNYPRFMKNAKNNQEQAKKY